MALKVTYRLSLTLLLSRAIGISLVGLLLSCFTPVERNKQNCPAPVIEPCKPGSFDKTTIDTSVREPGLTRTLIVALPSPVNMGTNDEAISFLDEQSAFAFVTSEREPSSAANNSASQHIFLMRSENATSYGPATELQLPDSLGSVGAPFYSQADGRLYFSAKADPEDPDDYDIFSAVVLISSHVVAVDDIKRVSGINAHGWFDSQPTLDPSGLAIYFVSDRPGGEGGTDIWYAHRSSLTSPWSTPEPLGANINTPCDELSPCISSKDPNTLYFSSNGHETVGGYDIFKAQGNGDTFMPAENLGKPINTEYDEVFPSIHDTSFFWSSNRPCEISGRSIYTIIHDRSVRYASGKTGIEPWLSNVEPQPVSKNETEQPKKKEELKKQTQEPGKPVTAVPINTVPITTSPNISSPITTTVIGNTVKSVVRINFPFDEYADPYEFIRDENGDSTWMTWHEALDTIATRALAVESKLKEVDIIGHTDSLGTEAYNDRLGFRRAEFVASELEKRGVPKRLLVIRSRGSQELLPHRPTEDDEHYRMRVRRVECVQILQSR